MAMLQICQPYGLGAGVVLVSSNHPSPSVTALGPENRPKPQKPSFLALFDEFQAFSSSA
jgi:hypothetical protein